MTNLDISNTHRGPAGTASRAGGLSHRASTGRLGIPCALLVFAVGACAPRASSAPASAAQSDAAPAASEGEAPAAPARSTPSSADYVTVNGLRVYYEVHGVGKPLLLLHGGLCTIDVCLGPLIPVLAPGRQLIAVEQQAHGHTADIDRPLTFEQMAEDTVAVLRTLQIQKADVFGYSDGGNVALRIAMKHPGLVDRLAVFGTNANNDGLAPGLVEAFRTLKPEDLPAEFREAYEKVAPDPQQFPTLVRKVMEQALAFKGWTRDDLQSIQAPALVMVGDRDIVRPEHAVEMFRQLPHAQLAILAATDHAAPITTAAEVGGIVDRFLRGPLPSASGFGEH